MIDSLASWRNLSDISTGMETNNNTILEDVQFINAGQGVKKLHTPEDPNAIAKDEAPQYKVIDSAWRDSPSVVNQFLKYPNSWKLHEVQTYIFDLSKEDDLQEYSKLETRVRQENTSVMEIYKDIVFCEKLGNWKVFYQVAAIKFKNILPQGVTK